MIGDELGYHFLTFDDEATLALAKDDPSGFVARLPERVTLDEVQRAPEIFRSLKLSVDRDRYPGHFILTGSVNPLLVPKLGDSLAGRMALLRLHPLSQSEMAKRRPTFLNALFGDGFPSPIATSFPPPRQTSLFKDNPDRQTVKPLGIDLANRIAAGGYPEPLELKTKVQVIEWYQQHVDSQVDRDARDLARLLSYRTLPKLLKVISSRTANPLNVDKLTEPFNLARGTISKHVNLLERMFLVDMLPSWHTDHRSRLVKKPKLHMGDTGMACALLNIDGDKLHQDRVNLGPMLETFVLQELTKQAGWHSEPLQLSYFRDKDGREVDIVVEQGARGPLVGIEVKASQGASNRDLRGLKRLASLAGDRFVRGIVLYDGPAPKHLGDRFQAVPIRRLWENP